MALVWEFSSPKLRSPEELREFYAIVLHRKNDVSRVVESSSTSSQSWAYLAGGRALSSSSTSLFSSHARTASSATSISDTKCPAALSTSTTHKVTLGQLVLRGSHPLCQQNVHRDTSGIVSGSGEANVGLESQSREAECGAGPLRDSIGEELYLLKSVRLDSGCQYCREHSLSCDRVKPSCWNCEQNIRHCLYQGGEGDAVQGLGCSSDETRIEPGTDDMPWLESLGIHPYHNLGGAKKIGRLETWVLKSRRSKLLTVSLRSEATIILEEEPKPEVDEEALLRQDPLASLEEESVPIAEDDTVSDESSVISSSTVLPEPCHFRTEHASHSSRTIALDLGVESSRAASPESFHLGKSITSPSYSSESQEICFEKIHDTAHNLSYSSTLRSLESDSVNRPVSFHCLFCLKRFDSQEEWATHEMLQHFLAQRFWVCMPKGPIEEADDGTEVCVFCLAVDLDAEHCAQHKVKRCLKKNVEDRTYRCKQDFEFHLQIFHGQDNMNVRTENWSSSPADDKWHWFCGFCDETMATWTQRGEHLSEHFKKGDSMSSWNLLVPSCPIDKNTGAPITWFSPLEMYGGALHTLQVQQLSHVERNPTLHEQEYCNYCQLYFESKRDAERHEELWHSPHNVWLCPTEADIRAAAHLPTGPLHLYLFPEISSSSRSSTDLCPYCGDSSDLWSGSDSDSDLADWDYRVRHLKSKHNFDRCNPDLRFYRPEQFLLHLADSHNLQLGSWMKGIVESCRTKAYLIDEIRKE
ncbi:uncharacterized protein PAC_14440 [Phialocephala subalpina]|uniref:Zn(2)-C6 fungal-type domain-containing protein n=1 Tax=Phialocephala subalpina TaxID=576137 RepID=A0A1L7XHN5_9HELO|nr:uncharacterized protein PAC_14440 [Phialocephala subalpina]